VVNECDRQQVEMHIGILAACLPTLKPLFASFFGQIRTFTKGRTTGSHNAPFKGSGYVRHDDGHSFALKNLSGSSQSRNVYDEDVVLGKETYIVSNGRRAKRVSGAGESDESILSHGKRASGRGLAIVRTTEVSVTR
jgi:hypothetical protein